ncbi:AEC family transporter [Zhongshania sp.]|uniref:AEC family transporter n=1 Tax=Zhongshania sp. TaxID=1971902 RepID=UPI00356830CA
MSLISPLIPVILPVILCAAIGVFWVRFKQPFDHEFVRRIVLWIGAPALIVGTLSKTAISAELLQHVLLASFCLLGFSAVFAAVACLLLRLNLRDFLIPLVFGNFGNMGLPLCLFAFGEEGLAIGLGIFLVTTVSHFSFGVAVLSGRAMIKGMASSPIIYAGALACILIFNHWQLPLALQNSLSLLGGMSIPLMLITLGVSLSSLQLRGVGKSVGLGCLRLLVGLGGGVATVYALELEGMIRNVVLLQSATPAAVFNYLLAMQYRREPDTVAGMVVSSTIISFITIPVLLYFLGVR